MTKTLRLLLLGPHIMIFTLYQTPTESRVLLNVLSLSMTPVEKVM